MPTDTTQEVGLYPVEQKLLGKLKPHTVISGIFSPVPAKQAV